MTSSAVSVSPVVPIDLISVKSYVIGDLVLVLWKCVKCFQLDVKQQSFDQSFTIQPCLKQLIRGTSNMAEIL